MNKASPFDIMCVCVLVFTFVVGGITTFIYSLVNYPNVVGWVVAVVLALLCINGLHALITKEP